jgi:hypothetical protein
MGVTVGVNGLSVVHEDSSGVVIAYPDTCNTPSPTGTLPIPYPNVAQASDTASASSKVTCDGNSICLSDSEFDSSSGDEAGSSGGVSSGKTRGKAEFILYSFDVKVEGKNVPRALDTMYNNDKNTAPTTLIQQPIVVVVT